MADCKTKGHLAIDKNSLIGKCFKFYGYLDDKRGIQDIHVNTNLDFMKISASLYGYTESDLVEGELEILKLLTGSEYGSEDAYNKASEGILFGLYKCMNYDYFYKEFVETDETVDFIYNIMVAMELCFNHADYRVEEDEGNYIGVVLKILNYKKLVE